MKCNLILTITLVLIMTGGLLAGPYSTAQNNQTPGAIDPGIPGFVNGDVNPVFVGWATECVDYSPAPGVSSTYSDPVATLGPVNSSIASLGDLDTAQIAAGDVPGEITLSFDASIYNGEGADFAVFENGFMSGGKLFAELAYVEVSTDGVNFVQFPSISLTEDLVGAYGTIDATDVYNLAGKHAKHYGTPFDLENLVGDPLVTSSLVDLNDINYVKLIDIPGSGDFLDSDGNSIYDAWVTRGSGGLDLDAVGVVNAVPEPSAIVLLIGLAVAVVSFRWKK